MTRHVAAPSKAQVAGAITWTWQQYVRAVQVTVDAAVTGQDRVRFVHLSGLYGRVDDLLDLWREADRAEQLTAWWVQSWPGTAPPAWPDETS